MTSLLDPNTVALLNQLGMDPNLIEAAFSSLLVLTIASLLAAIPTAMVAKRKGRSVVFWVTLALTIPVLPLLLVWLLPKASLDAAP